MLCKYKCPRATALLTTHIASYNSHRFLQLTPLLSTQIASCNSHRFLQLNANSHRFLQLTSLLANPHRFLEPHIAYCNTRQYVFCNSHRFSQPHIAFYNSSSCSLTSLLTTHIASCNLLSHKHAQTGNSLFGPTRCSPQNPNTLLHAKD